MIGSASGAANESRTCDAENHSITSSSEWGTTGSNGKLYYLYNATDWGPNGHPILIGGNADSTGTQPTQFDTLHWDGDQLLFTTNSSGQVDDVKVGAQGDILPLDSGYNGITFYSRLPNGAVMGCHNATGATFAGVADSYLKTIVPNYPLTEPVSPCSTSSPNIATGSPMMPNSIVWWGSTSFTPGQSGFPSPIGQGGVLGMPRTDGFTDYADTIQGVRSYDSSAGTWTAPDAYAGDVNDPASQKAYTWDGNNPVMYSDPSGYYQCEGTRTECEAVEKAANALRQQITAIINRSVNHALITRLNTLMGDLTPGKGTWVVQFGNLSGNILAETTSYVTKNQDQWPISVRGGPTTVDFHAFQSSSQRWRENALATEAGKYEMLSGTAGPALYKLSFQIVQNFNTQLINGHAYESDMAGLSNQYFTTPLGLPGDPCSQGIC
ncbi:MAG: hypothetical protein ACREMP_00360 [Candidatus Tyrphobacter sp.]